MMSAQFKLCSHCAQPLVAKVIIVIIERCWLTLGVIASLYYIRRTQRDLHLRWPVLNCPSLAGFNRPLT